jgi:hypothetical protein
VDECEPLPSSSLRSVLSHASAAKEARAKSSHGLWVRVTVDLRRLTETPCRNLLMVRDVAWEDERERLVHDPRPRARGFHSFQFQLNLSSSVHRMTKLTSCMCP